VNILGWIAMVGLGVANIVWIASLIYEEGSRAAYALCVVSFIGTLAALAYIGITLHAALP